MLRSESSVDLAGFRFMLRLAIPEVARDWIPEQKVVHLRAFLEVVNDQWSLAVIGGPINDDADVWAAAGKLPRHQIAGLITPWVLRNGKNSTSTAEKSLKVPHSPVINIWIGFREPPALWIGREVRDHILMNQPLKIDSESTVAADHQIRANPDPAGNITSRVWDPHIASVVHNRVRGALNRCRDQTAGKRSGLLLSRHLAADEYEARYDRPRTHDLISLGRSTGPRPRAVIFRSVNRRDESSGRRITVTAHPRRSVRLWPRRRSIRNRSIGFDEQDIGVPRSLGLAIVGFFTTAHVN